MKALLLLLAFVCVSSLAHAQYYTCVEGNYYVIAGNLYYSGDICGLAYPAPEGGWFVQCDATGYQFYNYEEQLNGGFYDPETFAEEFGCYPYFKTERPHRKYTNPFTEALFNPKVE